MKVAFLEYEFDFKKQVSGGSDVLVRNMYNIMSEFCEVNSFRLLDYDNIIELIKELDTYDIVIHNFLKGTFNHNNDTLATILTSLKHAVTLYIDHDRYPVYQTFYKQKMKAKITHACDYILTYSSCMYEKYFNKDRILSIGNFFNYRSSYNVSNIPKTIDILYQARISSTKGTLDYYKFIETLNKGGSKLLNILIGFGGSPAEIEFKRLPGNTLHIWKDKNRVENNSDNTFLHVFPFQKDFNKIVANIASSKFAWNCYKMNTKKPENLLQDKGLEGAALESILYGAIPIFNGYQRDLIIEGKKLEDYNCCLFLDNNDYIKLAIDFVEYYNNYNKYHDNLKVLANIFSDKQKYVNTYKEMLEYRVTHKKQQTAIIQENTYKELLDKNKTYFKDI